MYLGIEIGGTKLQLGIGPGDGTLEALWRGTVDKTRGGEGIREQIAAALPELFQQSGLAKCHLHGVGIGFGGPVDDNTNTVIKSHQIEGWDNFPLADWISDLVDLPAVLGNDADVAGLAEALFGAGKGLSPIFYITIGSGIGGGLIIDGEIYRGCGRGAAEIGHLRIFMLLRKEDIQVFWDPPLESIKILEQLSSGWAIEDTARAFATGNLLGSKSLLPEMVKGEFNKLTAAHVAEAAAQGDLQAKEMILGASWHYLAEGICHVITLLCPRRIVIGGGVSLIGEELLFQPLRKLVAERVFKPFADCYDIVPAALGEEVVVHGALALARKRLSR